MADRHSSHIVLTATLLLLVPLSLGGCATDSKLGNAVDGALQVVGLRAPKPEPAPVVPLRLVASATLNTGADKRPAAAVVKIYHLRSGQRFEQAPFKAFLDQAGEQAALGADLLSVNEVVLSPGGDQQLAEQLSDGTSVVGVVALFRQPSGPRWRMSFDAKQKSLPLEGITIGVHACAITSDSPGLLSRLPGPPGSLASVSCGSAR